MSSIDKQTLKYEVGIYTDLLEKRLLSGENRIQTLAQRILENQNPQIELRPDGSTVASAGCRNTPDGKRYIFLPALKLFSFADLPYRFQLSGFDDPKLNDPVWIQEFQLWLLLISKPLLLENERIAIAAKPENFRQILEEHIQLQADPLKHEQVIDFIYAHEIAHFEQPHIKFEKSAKSNVTISSIFLIAALRFQWFFSSLGLASLLLSTLYSAYAHRKVEKACDFEAIKACGTNAGGIAYFSLSKKRDEGILQMLWDANERFDNIFASHPLDRDRVTYLSTEAA